MGTAGLPVIAHVLTTQHTLLDRVLSHLLGRPGGGGGGGGTSSGMLPPGSGGGGGTVTASAHVSLSSIGTIGGGTQRTVSTRGPRMAAAAAAMAAAQLPERVPPLLPGLGGSLQALGRGGGAAAAAASGATSTGARTLPMPPSQLALLLPPGSSCVWVPVQSAMVVPDVSLYVQEPANAVKDLLIWQNRAAARPQALALVACSLQLKVGVCVCVCVCACVCRR